MRKKFDSKRFVLVAIAFVILSFMGVFAVVKGMEGIGSTVALSLAGVVTWYLQKETEKPSGK